MANHHDLGYKQLFAHPELVRELLVHFTPIDCKGTLDGAEFERVNPSYVSERDSARTDDLVWRVRCGPQWIYIYILLEFQSQVEHWMALRIQVYVGLLYQDLVKRHEVAAGAMLPPVLPLVFYSGAAAWHAERDLSRMIVAPPAGLEAFQAAQRYCLIDQQRLDPARLADQRALLALLFRSELSPTFDVVCEVLPMLSTWLVGPEQEALRRTVSLWLSRLVARELPEVSMNDALQLDPAATPTVRKFATWSAALKDEGRQEGLAAGKAEGKAEGMRLALHALVTRRFGTGAAEAACAAAAAPGADLEGWIVRAAEAPDVQALLGGGTAAG